VTSRLLVCLAATTLCSAQTPLTDLTSAIQAEVKPDTAMRNMRAVWETDRWFTFPKFHETAATLRRLLTEARLAEVEVLHAPADGVTQAGYWTMPMAWDAKAARLEIVEPKVDPKLRVLADFRETPASLCMWSGPTTQAGITASLVEHPGPAEALRGKFVLTRRNPAGLKWRLAREGVAGVINAFTENQWLQDERQWINSWGDNGWAFTKPSTPLPCFSITPRQADRLSELIKKHGQVRLRATADTRYYTDTYPYVTAVLPGSVAGPRREEVLVLGHTSEQGAHDNATGVAAMVEALSALQRLVAAGKLPRPARTIRFLAMGELYASMHYVQQNSERVQRTVAAFCVDTPAASYDLAGTEYTFYLNPHVARSFTDSLVLQIAGSYFSSISSRRPFHVRPFMPGTDTFLADPMIGIPTVWPYSGTGVNTHHNSADKPETVDARSLRDLTSITAAYLYAIASAGPTEALLMAQYAAGRGQEQVVASATSQIARLAAAPAGAEFPGALHHAMEAVEYQRDRELQAIQSTARIGAPKDQLGKLSDGMRAVAEAEKRRVLEFARTRVPRVSPMAPPPGDRDREAARLIVRRKRFGTLPLDDLRPDQREGFSSGAWDTRLITALYWCDGKRNLAEVIRLTELELGPSKVDWTGYFRFLAKKGYVDLSEAPGGRATGAE
jgi:hypothetical protein